MNRRDVKMLEIRRLCDRCRRPLVFPYEYTETGFILKAPGPLCKGCQEMAADQGRALGERK